MKNFMIYMVGTSGSGKTTIAEALLNELHQKKYFNRVQFIDGDDIRAQFGDIFGYTREERMKCNKVVRVVVGYLMKNNISVILAQVAAYEEMRQAVRQAVGDGYIEIYIKCSYEECARRDVKGYYKKQQSKSMSNLNGANDVYEVPVNADLVIDTEQESVDEAVKKIIKYLEDNEYVI